MKKEIIKILLIAAGILIVSVFFFRSCSDNLSKKYLKLKGEYMAYVEMAEKAKEESDEKRAELSKENRALREEVEDLEDEKRDALEGSEERQQEIEEKTQEIRILKDREKETQGLGELVINLRGQIKAQEERFTLAINDKQKETVARKAAEAQVIKLEAIIVNKDELIASLDRKYAAEHLARMAADDALRACEKDTVLNKIGRTVGNGFKIYGIFSAGRDIYKAVVK